MSVGGLDLAFDLEAREKRNVIAVELQATLDVSGHETLHVLLRLLKGGRIVDQHLPDVIRQVVAHGARDGIAFAVHEERGCALAGGGGDLVPLCA